MVEACCRPRVVLPRPPMAVSASALGAHVIRALDDMLLRGPLRKAGAELRGDARKLREQLEQELLYSLSQDVENRVLEDDRARRWLAELRQVLCRADDLLLRAYGGADAQDQRSSMSLSLPLPIVRRFTTDRHIKQEIRDLLKDIDSVSKNRPPVQTSRDMESYQHDRSCDGQKLMRRDNLVDTEKVEMRILPLVDKLTEHHEPSRQFLIFAIYGLGGVGKTTLARKIFDDQRTQSAFSTHIWVSISKGSSVAQILQATCAAPAIGVLEVPKRKSKLQMLLAEKIGGRRIFLVFNIYSGVPSKQGIGNAEIFGNLIEVLKFFHAAAEGSRVLITTSDENVGNEIKSAQIQKGAEGYGLQTEPIWQLTVEDSWMLLLRAACLEQAKVTPELEKIGIQILQKCNCLPLAIEVVGGVLRGRGYRQKEWEGIRDSSAFSLKDPTTGTEGGVRSSIYLSYQHAPPHLKQCFLYLSLFPVDFEIERHLVTQLWISEGLIDIGTGHGHSLEATADQQNSVSQQESNKHNSEETAQERNSAASEIVPVDDENNVSSEHARENTTSSQGIVEDHNRQPPKGSPSVISSGHSSKTSLDNKQSRCSAQEMADLYFKELEERGLVHQENKTKRYKMHEQVRKIAESLTENEVCAGDPKYVATLPANLYRLSFMNKGLTTISEDVGRLKSLRTLLLSGNPLGETDIDTICKNLELLRVLDLSDTDIQTVPKMLGNLVYLRHLDLSRTRIRALHESISRLRRLRFLGLRGCRHLTSLPKSIQKLSKLEYLDFRDGGITKSTSIQKLSKLEYLHGFIVDSMSSNGLLLEDLQNMSHLSDLHIDIRKIVDRNIASDGNGMLKLKEKDNLRNLEITVKSEALSDGELERLKAMFTQLHPHQCLVSLKIHGYHGTVYPGWLCSSDLPNLQHLSLENFEFCERLPPIWHLKNLKFLRIAKLSKLKKIDMQRTAEIPLFPNVEELEIEGMEDLEYWSDFRAGDLLHLRKLALRRCRNLKRLPGGLEYCKTMSKMELIDAGQVQVLEKIPVQELLVEAMSSVTEVSNLPLMKAFTVISCPNLVIVSGVNSLQHIHMEDGQLEQLPKWLGQHFPRIETLDIVGKEQLLARCERSKEDWYIVREIPRVYAYLPKRLPYFSYTRGNDFFCKHKTQRTDAFKDHLSSPEAGVQRTGSTSSSSFTGNDDSPWGPAAPVDEIGRKFFSLGSPPADETYKNVLSVMSLFVVIVLCMIMNLTDSHHNLLEDFSLFGFYVCTMFYFIYLVMKRHQ